MKCREKVIGVGVDLLKMPRRPSTIAAAGEKNLHRALCILSQQAKIFTL